MSLPGNTLKNGSYYLLESNETGLLPLRELSLKEYNEILEVSNFLHEYHYQKRRLREVELNLDDFFHRYKLYERKFVTGDYADKQDLMELTFIDLNRLLTNFLSSFRLYIDNLERYVKRIHGDKSANYEKFKSAIRHEFDLKFEYRLIYALRNYSQHNYFPINNIGMTVDIDPYTKGEYRNFNVSFDKDKLLEEPELFKHVLLDLTLYNNRFPVLPPLNKIRASLINVFNAFFEIEKEKLIEGINVFFSHLKHREQKGDIGFAVYEASSGAKASFNAREIPLPIIKQIYFDVEGKELRL